MGLAHGSRVGPYEVVALLGAGGMGEVWRARDGRLGREVAIKVLRTEAAHDPDYQRRLKQEARAAGALNHPAILVVFDVGEHEGAPYIVTELLAGASLRERLQAGPLAPGQALDFCGQLVAGLVAAHGQGLIHRDLKPENLFITKDRRLKILDFGLARVSRTPEAADALAGTDLQTTPGSVLGTAGYMAPEQVRGCPADARSDLFAVGAVLYEMLAGQPAFGAETPVERATATLHRQPDDLRSQGIAAPLAQLAARCLEKEPDHRFQTAHDLACAIELLAATVSTPPVAASTAGPTAVASGSTAATPRRSRRSLVALGATVLLALAASLVVARPWRRPPTVPAAAAVAPAIPQLTQLTYRRGRISAARFAPDGRTVLYSGSFEGEPSQVFQATPGSPEARPLSSLPGAQLLAVSATEELAVGVPFRQGLMALSRTVYRTSLAGGAPRAVVDGITQADWSPDGKELMVVRRDGRRWQVEYPIGRTVVTSDAWHLYARLSPRGDRIAVVEWPSAALPHARLDVVERDGRRRTLTDAYRSLISFAWNADASEIWFTTGEGGFAARSLLAVSLQGAVRPVYRAPTSIDVMDIDRRGRVLLATHHASHRIAGLVPGRQADLDLTWFDNSDSAALSADGRLHLFWVFGTSGARAPANVTYLRDTSAAGSMAVRLGDGLALAVSPDGKWALVWTGQQPTALQLLPTGAGAPRSLPSGSLATVTRAFFFPDGKRLLLVGREPERPPRVWVQELDPPAPPRPASEEGVIAAAPPAPDGRSIAAMTLAGRALLLPTGGSPTELEGLEPGDLPIQWTPDGAALFVRRVVDALRLDGYVTTAGRSAAIFRYDRRTRKREPWREVRAADADAGHIDNVSLTPDGRHFAYGYVAGADELFLVEGLR